MTAPILEINDLGKHFGGLAANQNIDFQVFPGEIVGIIGPNGAGKTTLFNCISGFAPPDTGRVTFNGGNITGHPAHAVARLGMARTFQVYARRRRSDRPGNRHGRGFHEYPLSPGGQEKIRPGFWKPSTLVKAPTTS